MKIIDTCEFCLSDITENDHHTLDIRHVEGWGAVYTTWCGKCNSSSYKICELCVKVVHNKQCKCTQKK